MAIEPVHFGVAVEIVARLLVSSGIRVWRRIHLRDLDPVDSMRREQNGLGEQRARVGGSVEPFVATYDAETRTITPVAVGAPVVYSADTGAFVSTAFGGLDGFALASATTLYAGFYWDDGGGLPLSPIGYASSGASYLHYWC